VGKGDKKYLIFRFLFFIVSVFERKMVRYFRKMNYIAFLPPPADKQVGTHRGQTPASKSIIQSRRGEAVE